MRSDLSLYLLQCYLDVRAESVEGSSKVCLFGVGSDESVVSSSQVWPGMSGVHHELQVGQSNHGLQSDHVLYCVSLNRKKDNISWILSSITSLSVFQA